MFFQVEDKSVAEIVGILFLEVVIATLFVFTIYAGISKMNINEYETVTIIEHNVFPKTVVDDELTQANYLEDIATLMSSLEKKNQIIQIHVESLEENLHRTPRDVWYQGINIIAGEILSLTKAIGYTPSYHESYEPVNLLRFSYHDLNYAILKINSNEFHTSEAGREEVLLLFKSYLSKSNQAIKYYQLDRKGNLQ